MDLTKDEFNIPNVIIDPQTRTQYAKGKFLGKVCWRYFFLLYFLYYLIIKGGFARCYELTNVSTGQIYAGKVVPKTMLIKPHQKEKVF
jgi:polo-like kinase 1